MAALNLQNGGDSCGLCTSVTFKYYEQNNKLETKTKHPLYRATLIYVSVLSDIVPRCFSQIVENLDLYHLSVLRSVPALWNHEIWLLLATTKEDLLTRGVWVLS